jgi:HAD superfamily hydrolase (TIGR01549 family)
MFEKECIHDVRAVLFDLDDTLFDHRHSCRSGLAAVQQNFQRLQEIPLDEVERGYMALLEESHPNVLQGVIALEEARVERFRRLFLQAGEEVSPARAGVCAELYQKAYRAARRPVPGAIPLLRRLRSMAKIAVVSNNLIEEQKEKLRCCELYPFVDCLVVSEEIGAAKPEPAIFEVVLSRLRCGAQEAVMVGDSWTEDIIGAHGVGIRPVWLNRYGRLCPDQALATEINSFEPVEVVLGVILRRGRIEDRKA